MGIAMNASDFVKKLTDIATNYKTLYVMGCFGSPMTSANKTRLINHHSYNKQASRQKMIKAATADTFGFDCVNLIKGVLWGWNGDKKKTYGGAKYKDNDVPDTNADGMIKLCSKVTTKFDKIEVGEAVWTDGHIGVYIGNGLAVECTPSWANKVQITACNCKKTGYKTRTWKKHGKLPWIKYDVKTTAPTTKPVAKPVAKPTTKPATTKTVTTTESADKFDKTLAATYTTTGNLNMRNDAGTASKILCTVPKGTKVKCYGYYSTCASVKWLLVQFTMAGTMYTGFCSSRYLKK